MAYEFNENKKVIVIAHPSRKKHYLSIKNNNPYLDMEVMNLNELKGMFDYQYDNRALVFVMKEGYGYKESKDILQALAARHYERGEEVKKFDGLRNRLIKDGFLFKLPYPEKTFENADILISGYYGEDELLKEYLGDILLTHDEEENKEPIKTYLKFSDIYEELHYVFNQIASDLDQGTPIDKVYVYGASKDYQSLINQFSKYYGFVIDMETPCRLFDTNIYRFFRKEYLESDLETSISKMREEYKDSKDADTIEKLSRAYCQVFESDKEKTIALFDEIAKEERKHAPIKKNVVQVLDEAVCQEDAHLYFLNFSMGTYPKSPSEGGYFSDEEKERIGLETAKSRSHKDAEIIEHALRSKSLKSITFAEDIFGSTKFECAFKDKYLMVGTNNPKSKVEYAKDKGAFLCANLQDFKRNYLQEDPRRKVYEEITKVSLDYQTFDNSFKGKKEGRYPSRKYSYSSLKTYRECHFKYLLSKVLYLDSHEANFGASIGNVFHGVFEQHYKDQTIDFDTAFENSLKMEQGLIPNPDKTHNEEKKEFDQEQKAMIANLKEYCKIAFDFQLKYEKFLQNATFFPEKEFKITLDNGVIVTGRYDKITEFEYNGKKYCFIIDYKTNSERFNEKLLRNFGLSLQLPVYAMAITHDQAFLGDAKLAGLFISPILNFDLENKDGKEILVEDQKGLKLNGVFLNDIELFSKIDPLMEETSQFIDGSYVEGFRLKKNGLEFYRQSDLPRNKSEEGLLELGEIAEKHIKEFDERITNSDFRIDPLVIKGNCNACEYCQFHDICFIDKRKIKSVSIDGESINDEEGEEDGE